VKPGQVLELLLPLLDGPEGLTAPVIELPAPVTLAGEVPQLHDSATMARALDNAPIGVTLDIFHTL